MEVCAPKRMVAALLSLCLLLQSVIFAAAADVEGESVGEVISRGFYEFCESIDISTYEIYPEELTHIVSSVIKDDPYLFFVNGHLSYSYKSGGHVLSLKPTYNMTEEEVFSAWETCRSRVREIAEMAMEYESQAERALFAHDYICEHFEYDESLESDDLFDFFETGAGTCQGYAAVYMAVLRECGIACRYVASDTIAHIWNYVEIDGEWYHVDLTWDDSATGATSRRHFLLSDRVAEERGHRDWYSSSVVVCDSEKYADVKFDGWLQDKHLAGDGDHGGSVDLADLLYLRKQLSMGNISHLCASCADINADGTLDALDAERLRKKLLSTH